MVKLEVFFDCRSPAFRVHQAFYVVEIRHVALALLALFEHFHLLEKKP